MSNLTYKQICDNPSIIIEIKGFVNLQCNQCSKSYNIRKAEVTRQAIKNQKENNFCSLECAGLYNQNRITLNCVECSKQITRKPSDLIYVTNSFCSSSCSAKHQNRNRTEKTRKKQGETLRKKILNGELIMPVSIGTRISQRNTKLLPHSKIKFRKCRTTGLGYKYWDEVNGVVNKRSPHITLVLTEWEIYKKNCMFKFTVEDYPNEFDMTLVETNGWHTCPGTKKGTKTENGVCRDHIVSVKFGFENNISPSIISHPANCQLLTVKENSRKCHRCDLSLEELLEKINAWNKKYQ